MNAPPDSLQGLCKMIAEAALLSHLTKKEEVGFHNQYFHLRSPQVANYTVENRAWALKVIKGIIQCTVEVLSASDVNVNDVEHHFYPLGLASIGYMTAQRDPPSLDPSAPNYYSWGDNVDNPLRHFDGSFSPYIVNACLQTVLSDGWRRWNALGHEDHMALDQRGSREPLDITTFRGCTSSLGLMWCILGNVTTPDGWRCLWVGFLYRLVARAKQTSLTTWTLRNGQLYARPEALGVLSLGIVALQWAIPRTYDVVLAPSLPKTNPRRVLMSVDEVKTALQAVVQDASEHADLDQARNQLNELLKMLWELESATIHKLCSPQIAAAAKAG